MVAFGSIIPLEQGGRRVFGMSWMPVSGVCIGSRVERAVRDASRTHFHVGTGILWNLETPGVSRKKQRELRVKYGFGHIDVNDEERGRVLGVIDTFQSEGDPGRQGT